MLFGLSAIASRLGVVAAPPLYPTSAYPRSSARIKIKFGRFRGACEDLLESLIPCKPKPKKKKGGGGGGYQEPNTCKTKA